MTMYGRQEDHINAMCSISPLKLYTNPSPLGRHEVSERQIGVLGVKRYVVSRMGEDYGPPKVDRAEAKSKSVIRMGE